MPNRNVESHFAYNPTNIDIQRSSFDLSRSWKTTFNVGDIVPLCPPMEVLPGDTFQVDTSKVVRLQTLLTPMMDNLYMDTYWFYVPNRLVWNHWKEFMGENNESAWLPSTEYSVPQITPPENGWNIGTIADYFGLPVKADAETGLEVSALPFRGYALICNDWFRSEVVSDPLVISTGDADQVGSNGTGLSDVALGGMPYKAAKFFDLFTGCLPSPQKGTNVKIPLTTDGFAPVGTRRITHGYNDGPLNAAIGSSTTEYKLNSANSSGGALSLATSSTYGVKPINLWASVSDVSATINDLRLAFQIQKLYEKDARGGSRYIEVLKAHFGVTSPDARLQRPEYLGGNRIPLNINQVIQQSGDANETFLGDLGATSLTVDNHSDFTHSFVEHGMLFCLGVVRYDHTYQQNVEKMWTRKSRFDYYWPVLANIGEQPVYTRQVFMSPQSQDTDWNDVFGYNEAWAEYRYLPNGVSCEMRSDAPQSLDSWHLADDYSDAPTLSDSWIREDKSNVDRVLAVSSSVSKQCFADFYFKIKATRPMPVYSVPGLIDHH